MGSNNGLSSRKIVPYLNYVSNSPDGVEPVIVFRKGEMYYREGDEYIATRRCKCGAWYHPACPVAMHRAKSLLQPAPDSEFWQLSSERQIRLNSSRRIIRRVER